MSVLAIGSSLIDFFIKIEKNDQIELSDEKVTLPLGAKLPIDIKSLSLGGNSANVSTALHNLSIPVTLYTYLGNDPLSKHIKEKLEDRGVNLIVEDINVTTGSLSLIFDFPTDRIIFSHHNMTSYGFSADKIVKKPDLIFLSSIGDEWEDAYEKVLSYAQENNIPIAFSPGSSQLKNMNETFLKTVKFSKILLCNMSEAKRIYKALTNNDTEDSKQLLLELKKNDFDTLSITDAQNGAFAVDKDNNVYRINTLKPEGHEKTGAGDAYAGAFLAGVCLDKSIEESMKWGVLNALGEMKQVGAGTGLLTLEQVEKETNNNEDLSVEKL